LGSVDEYARMDTGVDACGPVAVIRRFIEQSVALNKGGSEMVPLRIEFEPGYPEDVAFGTQRQMDRLKKWLDKFFALRDAEHAGGRKAWADAERIADVPAVHEALQGFSEDATGDNGTCVVRAVLEAVAAPQPCAHAACLDELF